MTYRVTRFLILRLLGFVYFFAFLSLVRQLKPLIGSQGLTPAFLFLGNIRAQEPSALRAFMDLPTLFWLGPGDQVMTVLAWAGLFLSALVLLGYAPGVLLLSLWGLYLSFVHVGQDWYGYGWEIQLLETGFLAIFLVPFLDGRPFPRPDPPRAVLWLFRWLIFRVMIGAGMIKMRGDPCWRDLSCLIYHYETQPIPNPLSRWLHFHPPWFHKAGALLNHVTELVAPWFMLGPARLRRGAGLLMAAFQIFLILSGNLSFLNWLTLVPILSCLDDGFWLSLLPAAFRSRTEKILQGSPPSRTLKAAAAAYCGVVVLLSLKPTANLLSPGQMMNTSFDRLHLVNTYGAFGSVGRERLQIVIEGCAEENADQGRWRAYDYFAQPSDPMRAPRVCAPYQPRLDWQIWFAAMGEPRQYPWVFNLVWKLLQNDKGALSLFAKNPFPDAPPRWVRLRLFRYRFAPPSDPSGAYWIREERGLWLPPLGAGDPRLLQILRSYGWI